MKYEKHVVMLPPGCWEKLAAIADAEARDRAAVCRQALMQRAGMAPALDAYSLARDVSSMEVAPRATESRQIEAPKLAPQSRQQWADPSQPVLDTGAAVRRCRQEAEDFLRWDGDHAKHRQAVGKALRATAITQEEHDDLMKEIAAVERQDSLGQVDTEHSAE